ncbi:hypothetical protein LPTSP4_09080 [Leptospira ryugenii]|uniref:Uncharacterized protein n=1 Tax=Leptospira ryugenii TaxID=1917863 RepID=A0A2P2DXN6_9LEPT|nr:hypothetical protein [Leptospira ryugenii]GBF49395.1 hypothetical protein LPTSP4_09080 [Leptospira ryugenii]
MKGRFYVYLPTNKKYNYPKAEGLLFNTQEKRFSFLVDLDASGKATGETSGRVIRDFQKLNPGISIIKVETKALNTSVPIVQTPVRNQVKPSVKKDDDSSGMVLVAGLLIIGSLLF